MRIRIVLGYNKDPEENWLKYYKKEGWLHNKYFEAIYYDTEMPFMPHEGQRLSVKNQLKIVSYACYQVYEEYDGFDGVTMIYVKDE